MKNKPEQISLKHARRMMESNPALKLVLSGNNSLEGIRQGYRNGQDVLVIPRTWIMGNRKRVIGSYLRRYDYDRSAKIQAKIDADFPEILSPDYPDLRVVNSADLDRMISFLGPDFYNVDVAAREERDKEAEKDRQAAEKESDGQGEDGPENGPLDDVDLDTASGNASDQCCGEADPSSDGSPVPNMPESSATPSASQPCSRETQPKLSGPASGGPARRLAGKGTGKESADDLSATDSQKPNCAASADSRTRASDLDLADCGSDPMDPASACPEKTLESSEPGNSVTDSDGNSEAKPGLSEILAELEAKQGSGGEYADFSGSQKPTLALSRDARQIKISLEKIFRLMDISDHGEQSPRIKGKALVRELVSKRISLSKCHREEVEHKKIIILVDVSGSCSHVAGDMVAAAMAIYETAPDRLAIIAHSNGCYNPDRGYWDDKIIGLDPARITKEDRYGGENKIDLSGMLHEIAGVVAFGDQDAADVYQMICEAEIPFIWLDHQLKNWRDEHKTRAVNVFPLDSRSVHAWKRGPLAWIGGVVNGPSAAAALRALAKDKAKWKK